MMLEIMNNVENWSEMLEINPTVDLAGPTELPKLLMTEFVSKPKDKLLLLFLPLTLPDVAISFHVCQWDVMEVKSVPHGLGSKNTVL